MVLGALLFVLGFTAVFVLGSIFVTTAGRALIEHRTLLMRVGGVLVILMGLVFLGVGSQREAKIGWRPRAGLAGAPVLGAVFALGWAPCTGPTLAAVLVMATATRTRRSAAACCSRRPTAWASACRSSSSRPGSTGPGAPRAGCAATSAASRSSAASCSCSSGCCMVTGAWEDLNSWLQTELVNSFRVSL